MSGQSPGDVPGDDVRTRLRRALREALKTRDMVAASALRSALGAIGNSEAVPAVASRAGAASNPYVAGTIDGLGGAEAERRILSEAEAAAIVRTEIAERHVAAGQYEQAGHADRAGRLRREADVLRSAVESGRDC